MIGSGSTLPTAKLPSGPCQVTKMSSLSPSRKYAARSWWSMKVPGIRTRNFAAPLPLVLPPWRNREAQPSSQIAVGKNETAVTPLPGKPMIRKVSRWPGRRRPSVLALGFIHRDLRRSADPASAVVSAHMPTTTMVERRTPTRLIATQVIGRLRHLTTVAEYYAADAPAFDSRPSRHRPAATPPFRRRSRLHQETQCQDRDGDEP